MGATATFGRVLFAFVFIASAVNKLSSLAEGGEMLDSVSPRLAVARRSSSPVGASSSARSELHWKPHIDERTSRARDVSSSSSMWRRARVDVDVDEPSSSSPSRASTTTTRDDDGDADRRSSSAAFAASSAFAAASALDGDAKSNAAGARAPTELYPSRNRARELRCNDR